MASRVHDRHPDCDGAAELERAAAEWFFRGDGGLTREEEAAFRHWLGEDDRHAAAFAEIAGTWRSLGEAEVHVTQAVAADERCGRLLCLPHARGRQAETPAATPQKRPAWFPMGLAAAAAIALAFIGSLIAPKLRHAGGIPASRTVTFAEQAATEIGGLRKLDLPDGSFVTLNTNSAVDVQFTAGERRVRLLRGEAHFTVAKNPRQPFIVEASGVAVRAVGTAFNVRREGAIVEIVVTEGKVRVDDVVHGATLLGTPAQRTASAAPATGGEPVLAAGQKLVVSVKSDATPAVATAAAISAGEIEQTLAWRQRRLDYTDATLSEIVADFNRYNQHRLVIPDTRLASRRFGGSYPAGDYTSFVQLLETTFGVVVERRERETVLRLP